MPFYDFYNDFSASLAMALFFTRCISETAALICICDTQLEAIELFNWRKVYFAERRNCHPASASNCDSCASCFDGISIFSESSNTVGLVQFLSEFK